MSGICGWLGADHLAIENQQIIDRMTGSLIRFDSNPVQTAVQGNAALSVAAKQAIRICMKKKAYW